MGESKRRKRLDPNYGKPKESIDRVPDPLPNRSKMAQTYLSIVAGLLIGDSIDKP